MRCWQFSDMDDGTSAAALWRVAEVQSVIDSAFKAQNAGPGDHLIAVVTDAAIFTAISQNVGQKRVQGHALMYEVPMQ